MLIAGRTTLRTTAGTITRLGLERIKLRASEIITPQLGVGAWVPAPRKLRLASTMMALDSTTEATTSSAPSTFARRCRQSVRGSRVRHPRAADTKTDWRSPQQERSGQRVVGRGRVNTQR